MSSSYIVEPQESGSKKDDTLIIVVNDDGTISVDQETLQNLIMNQSDANVSVVRVGQTDGDAANGDLTLTVDPPPFAPPEPSATATTTANSDATGFVDPFMEMDPEQLEKLETALQSEQAKQILGENVTAMLDMLTVEEQQKSIKYCIELDHCYTSRTSPTDPEPSDPLPIANSPDIDDFEYKPTTPSQQPCSILLPSTTQVADIGTPVSRPKSQARSAARTAGRGRKSGGPGTPQVAGVAKPAGIAVSRNANVVQQTPNKGVSSNRLEEEEEEEASSSSESSESEPPSDNDSDFGPRGPRRGGVRARGGRKGLTTRGGSMTATRRRASNKHMDMEQVRRLDMEMAAAVDAMKSPDKPERADRFKPVKARKQLKTLSSKKREDPSPIRGPPVNETPPTVYEKPLQTTNQVKANLISANMIKGDMILTKPGQDRNNQKVMFVQKKVMVRANEMKNTGVRKPSLVVTKGGKTMPAQIQTTLGSSEDGKLISTSGKPVVQSVQIVQPKTTIPTPLHTTISPTGPVAVAVQQQESHSTSSPVIQQHQESPPPSTPPPPSTLPIPPQQSAKPSAVSSILKVKTVEVKKEKKKSESETTTKVDEIPKPLEVKTPDALKKHPKKDQRKSPGVLADALGPALFSTPDIIRRVGSGAEAKGPDVPGTPTTPTAPTTPTSADIYSDTGPASVSSALPPDIVSPAVSMKTQEETSSVAVQLPQTHNQSDDLAMQINAEREEHSLPQIENDELKAETKVPTAEELQPSLDPATNAALAEGTPDLTKSTEEPVVPNQIVSEHTGIEGEENLFATLEMDASKHEEALLAEALLLQEELGVDLGDHVALVGPTASIPEPLLSTSSFDSAMENAEASESLKAPESMSDVSSPAIAASALTETSKKKDEKEPIQIVRGGRVITLPPIEAPATRSKRLQVKPEIQQKALETPKREEKVIKKNQMQQHHVKEMEEMESEMDDDDEEDNSDSEDDPDRLWCICKRPHNNRFMICCDVCEDWFHGKCVHVSKAMGQQMEEKGIEWVCPNCTKKKEEEANAKQMKLHATPGKPLKLELPTQVSQDPVPQATSPRTVVLSNEKDVKLSIAVDHGMAPVSGVTQCVVCKKEARNSSIYCSDACILMHAQETLTKESKPVATVPTATGVQTKPMKGQNDGVKPASDPRVIVFERRTGKVLTGAEAPTTSNLKTWLKDNPTFEVVRPNNLNTVQIGRKTVTTIQAQGVTKLIKTGQGTPGQTKMVYAKVLGSKQTVLAPSNKKVVVLSSGVQQQRASVSPKTIQQKQQLVLTTTKGSPGVMRQTTIKVVPQQVKSPVTTPKPQNVKKPEAKSPAPQQPQKPVVQKPSVAKKPEPEPIRINVRKTLAELLTTRVKETQDLILSEEEINDLALNIELELYKYFRDTGAKYKAKYRSLVFNIKDTKNLTLFRKICNRSLTPDAVVRLSPDEMASQELAEWREKETKHQLEMIKKNELDLMAQAKSIVVKTHKGEQIIENDGGIDHVDPKTPVQDIVTALNSHESVDEVDDKDEKIGQLNDDSKKPAKGADDAKKKREKERDKDRDRGVSSRDKDRVKEDKRDRSHSRSRSHRSRDRDRSKDRRSTRSKDSKKDKGGRERERDKDRERDKGKEKQKDKERGPKKSRSSRGTHRDYKDKDKKDQEERKGSKDRDLKKNDDSTSQADKPIEDRLWRHVEEETTTNTFDGNDSDVSDREPSSTVNIKTPDINEDVEREKEVEVEPPQVPKQSVPKGPSQTVWRGFVNMVDVAKFFITAQEVSGLAKDLMEDLPDTVDVVGRISHETVWDYISKMKKTGSKEILVIRLTAANDEEKIPYITLYSYLNSRSRLGVVGNVSKNIKDFYIMPFSRQSQLPPVLLPLIGPGFEDQRPHLLLGIIVRNKRKRILTAPGGAIPAKLSKKDNDSSFPVPPANGSKDKTNVLGSSPPDSPRPIHKGQILESLKEKHALSQIARDNLSKSHAGLSRSIIDSATLSKIVPELSSKKIDLSNSPRGPLDEDDDGDEPYSPGGIDDDPDDSLLKCNIGNVSASILSPTKNSTELQRKMDELNRQIEEQKQQIQSISSSFLGDATTTLPGLGLDPPDVADMDEAYSPTDSRSFTPPPPGIAKLAQPILDKVSDITIPPNLQEILANVKRQESSKVDPYLPSKPSATFLTSSNSSVYQKPEKYTPTFIKNSPAGRLATMEKPIYETTQTAPKESKSTLRSLSDLDLIKKAEEELAAVAAAAATPTVSQSPPAMLASTPAATKVPLPFSSPTATAISALATSVFPGLSDTSSDMTYPPPNLTDSIKKSNNSNFASDQPKPPGLEDEDLPIFPSSLPTPSQKFVPKSGVVLSVKRKVSDDGTAVTPVKAPRTKSRWGQGPSD